MKTAVIYSRFSPRPNGDTCESIELQQERCTALCVAKDWPRVLYSDREISGKRADNRPGLQDALDNVCQAKGVLVVYSLSRLSRSTRDVIDIADRLNKAGADLYSLNESLDTTTPQGRFVLTMFAALAQLEREQTSQRTADALQRMQRHGYRVSRRPPYGWKLDPDDSARIVKDATEQDTIAKVVHAYHNASKSTREIVRILQSYNVRPRAGRWQHKTVQRILERAKVIDAPTA